MCSERFRREWQKRVVPVVIEGAPVQPAFDEQVNTEKPVSNPAVTHVMKLSW